MAANTKVTRIKAKDASTKPATARKAPAKKAPKEKEPSNNVFARIGGYFVGAWEELKQVRWPNRKSTWGLSIAVILFSLFFVVVILLLDILFKYLFELIIT